MSRRSSSPTLREIARRANVSVGTVSRVLNRHEDVAEELRDRVEAVVRKVGYRLSARTQSVVQTKAKVIALIACGEGTAGTQLAPLLLGVEEYCSECGYFLLFSRQASTTPHSPALAPILTQGLADSVIVVGTLDAGFLFSLDQSGMRYVLLANEASVSSQALEACNTIRYDERGGCVEAVQYLAKLGHSHIWFIGDAAKASHLNRLNAYKRAMSDLQLEQHAYTVAVSEDDFDNGQAAISFILEHEWPITAILAASEELAFGAREGLRQHRRDIPKDISLIGVECGSRLSHSSNVTSVSIDMVEIGRELAKAAIDQISQRAEVRHVTVPVKLTKRSTCRPLRKEEHMML